MKIMVKKLIIDGLIRDKGLLVMIVAFVITIAVVYMIRRLEVDYSWSIAMIVGAILNIVIILIGDLMYDTQVSMFGAFLATILALIIAKVLEFMFFCVDYSRTEKVQFEDDEYYYYVKAIPKMNVAAQSKTVKKINSQRSATVQRSSSQSRGGQRSVVTERTETRRRDMQSNVNDRNLTSGGRSVTIGSYLDEDDFKDLD